MKSLLLVSILFLSSCAGLSPEDQKSVSMGEKYPSCHHQYKIVFEKCVELNESGQSVDAMRAEQLMRDGKI